MTRIDFYILPDAKPRGREEFCCRLIEKIYKLGHRVTLYTDSAEQTSEMDNMLWTFRQGSFLPHAIVPKTRALPNKQITNKQSDIEAPIMIGHESMSDTSADVIINLSSGIPESFSRYARLAEIIDQNEQAKRQGRERFRFYQQNGLTVETHTL